MSKKNASSEYPFQNLVPDAVFHLKNLLHVVYQAPHLSGRDVECPLLSFMSSKWAWRKPFI
jgi:hypothetical protein